MMASARQPLLLHAAVTEQASRGISLSTALQLSTVGVAPIFTFWGMRGRVEEASRIHLFAAEVSRP